MLGILTCMPSMLFGRSEIDSLVLSRVFDYRRNYTTNDVNGFTSNVYIKSNFNIWRRNWTLWLIPSMYSVADGERYLVSESYNKLHFNDFKNYEVIRQACFSTIRHNRNALPTIDEFLTPNIYDVCLYKDHILSPFSKPNRLYYQYHVLPSLNGAAIIEFKPRFLDNTQLVYGTATVDVQTGRIIKAHFNGEFDMINFHTETEQGEEGMRSLLPRQCKTNVRFRFMGNQIYATFDAVYDCETTLPDSMRNVFSLALMDSIRPIALTAQERHVMDVYKEANETEEPEEIDSIKKFNFVKDVLQDAIGDNLITTLRFKSERANMSLSPILNPQYVSYSRTHGFSYKIKLGAQYYFNAHRYFELYPRLGYNFKYKKFYFTLPFDFNYNPKRNGRVNVTYGNGNRIGNSSITREIQREHSDTLQLGGKRLDFFDDNYLTISNNIMAYDWLEINSGITYHHRVSYNPDELQKYGKPQKYNSMAPMLSVKLQPWHNGPILSVDYERGIKGFLKSDIDYERWEFDGSIKYDINPLRKINMKVGGGFYSRKKDNYFVDFMHFRDNKLPEGWDDEWTGNFQLLNSNWYNESRYYARANISYESPFLLTSWLPLVGRLVERERFYISALSIDNTRPYSELGYAFTTRLLSIGLFASFLNTEFQNFECKFTFELFRRW